MDLHRQSESPGRIDRYPRHGVTYSMSRMMWQISFILVVIALGMARSNDSKTLSVQTLNITSADGKVRATLGLSAEGTPEFRMFDEEGKDRIVVGVRKDNTPSIELFQDNGRRGVSVTIDDSNISMVEIGDPEHDQTLNIHAVPGGQALLSVKDAEGHPRARIGLSSDRIPLISLLDPNEKHRIHHQIAGKEAMIYFSSESGVIRSQIGEDKEDNAVFVVNDLNGKPRAFIRSGPVLPGGLFIRNESEDEVFSIRERGQSSLMTFLNREEGLIMAIGNLGDTSLGASIKAIDPNDKQARMIDDNDKLILRANRVKSSLELTAPDGDTAIFVEAVNGIAPKVYTKKSAAKAILDLKK